METIEEMLSADLVNARSTKMDALDEEILRAARDCNQHKHVEGCDKADVEGEFKNLSNNQKIDMLKGKVATAVDKKTGKAIHHQITFEQATAIVSWGEMGVDREGRIWFMDKGNKYVLEAETEPKKKKAESRIKSDSDGGANLLILPTGDVHQVSDNDLKHYKYNTKFSAFHVNKDGTYAGTPEDGLMLGATLDEALNRFPALSDAAKKDVRSFFSANEKNGKLRFYRMKFN